MSLTSFVNDRAVREQIKPLRPTLPRIIPASLQVEPKSSRYSLVGTAFDYLLRFELQRRAPHAVTQPWVAEHAPDLIWDLIWKEREGGGSGLGLDRLYIRDPMNKSFSTCHGSVWPTGNPSTRKMSLLCPNCQTMLMVPEQFAGRLMNCPLCRGTFTVPALAAAAAASVQAAPAEPVPSFRFQEEVVNRAREIVGNAKAAVTAYVKLRRPNRAQRADLASHAIRLAKLDSVYRALKLDPHFQDADPEDVEELLSLLAIVPFDSLLHDKVLLLNPHFQQVSREVGGADVDLIVGDVLVDLKTTKESEIKVNYLDQLLGYYLLARRLRRIDPTFPEINRLAIYFCRHGHLWVAEATRWTDNPRFSEVEEWFFKRAKEVYRRA